MKSWNHIDLLLVIGAVCLAGACPSAFAAVRFDTPAEYTGQFVEYESGNELFEWGSEAGVGGAAGRINVLPSERLSGEARYATTYDLGGGQAYSVSAYFLAGDVAAGRFARLGFTPEPVTGFPGVPWVAAQVRARRLGELDYGERYGLVAVTRRDVNAEEDTDEATPVAEAFALTEGNWYRFETTWAYAGAGEFRYGVALTDYGADGLTPDPASIHSIAGSFANAAFADPADVAGLYPTVEAMNYQTAPTLAWDEFAVTPVPEPAGLMLAAAAAGLLLARRRVP